MTRRAWGVYRELAHSPGRETDDAEILRATAAELTSRGFEVELKAPDELPEASDPGTAVPSLLFVMCERPEAVEKLAAWAKRGTRVVNRPAGIRNTDRERTLSLFASHGIPFPSSVLVETSRPAAAAFHGPCWVKRGDVHATEAGDVAHAGSAGELAVHLERLSERGIPRAVVQDHVPGDLVKFYGVAGSDDGTRSSWFEWFHHRDQDLRGHAFDAAALAQVAARAARALGLDVYGGDAIVSAGGRIAIIDVNAWPSFALFRPVAAAKIAALLSERFARDASVGAAP
jgi:glutathione synthase/RimK-type ligase-like ATP-grasp enzyme